MRIWSAYLLAIIVPCFYRLCDTDETVLCWNSSRLNKSYLFTGRSEERERLRTFFADLADLAACPAKVILNPYGVSGVGKTAILQLAIAECRSDCRRTHVVALDLDSQSWTPTSPLSDFFWNLRCQMVFSTPVFDCLYFLLWRIEHPGQKFILNDSILRTLLEDSGDLGGVLSTASETFHGGGQLVVPLTFLIGLRCGFAIVRGRPG